MTMCIRGDKNTQTKYISGEVGYVSRYAMAQKCYRALILEKI